MYIFDLGEKVTLAEAGGKGLNLHLLVAAGFNVPHGFIVTTNAYMEYVKHNDLQQVITENITEIEDDIDSLQSASKLIREAFSRGTIPNNIREEIQAAYSRTRGKVAVRSSSTAEDLPETSFAGQQDTFLNVEGVDAVLQAVVDCWSSLWTPRAIGYRERNQIHQDEVTLAVVVQRMVQSEASGVMFTVNPLTGVRTEVVINATFGLGDLLVSGRIEPDEYIVDRASGEVKELRIGAKSGDERRALSDDQIRELTGIGVDIHEHYGYPQDIEWAYADDVFYVLQSRPVTGLYPVLERVPLEPLHVYGSLGHVQGVLQPMTPMGRDFIRYALGYAQMRFGGRFNPWENLFMTSAGGRLYINITGLVRNKRFHGAMKTALEYVEPSMRQVMEPMLEDPRIEKTDSLPGLGSLYHLVRGAGPIFLRFIATLLRPIQSRESMNQMIDDRLESWGNIQMEAQTIEEHIEFIDRLLRWTPRTVLIIVPRLMAGIGMFFQMKIRAEKLGLGIDALNISRGLPHNVTTEMDLMLWEKTQRVREDEESRRFLSRDVEDLVKAYREGRLPQLLQGALDDFLSSYGMRGVAEIDIGSTRWGDDPSHIVQLMQTYLMIEDPGKAPDVVFKEMADSAKVSLERIEEEADRQRGWFSKRLIRFLGFRVRNLAGLRETPKFFMINVLCIARRSVLEIGRQLAARGLLEDSWDIFYLHLHELEDSDTDYRRRVEERKRQQRIDAQKKPPRVILSDGHIFYGSEAASGNTLKGSPVSPGLVEGVVHVMLDPTSETLKPGEILVCPATDPAWTPLFLAAGGLVMEVGGLMTHGSIVAREYGIPAVVGVSEATTLLKTGQRIRVDGEKGVVEILE